VAEADLMAIADELGAITKALTGTDPVHRSVPDVLSDIHDALALITEELPALTQAVNGVRRAIELLGIDPK
jgi:hypothetical protein